MNDQSQLAFSLLRSQGPWPMLLRDSYILGGSSHLTQSKNLKKNPLQAYSEVCFHSDSKSHQADNPNYHKKIPKFLDLCPIPRKV